eukprot:10445819-Alexandrium_andersonii.AAC.1
MAERHPSTQLGASRVRAAAAAGPRAGSLAHTATQRLREKHRRSCRSDHLACREQHLQHLAGSMPPRQHCAR